MLDDPQGFAERLLAALRKSQDKFEVRGGEWAEGREAGGASKRESARASERQRQREGAPKEGQGRLRGDRGRGGGGATGRETVQRLAVGPAALPRPLSPLNPPPGGPGRTEAGGPRVEGGSDALADRPEAWPGTWATPGAWPGPRPGPDQDHSMAGRSLVAGWAGGGNAAERMGAGWCIGGGGKGTG